MKNLLKNIQNTNARHALWRRGDTIILGISGGADSMCLLHTFSRLATKERLTIIVAHVNYGLRGNAAHRDARHVMRWAERLELVYEEYTIPRHMRGKSEDAWRTLRYDYFARLAKKYHAHRIAVAHHRDDQAETLLLNLFRGSGPDGLRAMPYHHPTTHVIRPLLDVRRHDTVAYCREHHIRYYHDTSNDDTTFTRNHIRLRLIPYLAKNYNPQIVTTLAHTAELLADTEKKPRHLHRDLSLSDIRPKEITYDVRDFTQSSIAQQRHLLRAIAQTLTKKRLTYGTLENLRRALTSKKNKRRVVQTRGLKCSIKGAIVTFTYEK